ncbi:E3 ubiquitin-protein ligase TRIM39-like isoform 2-T3 [Pholidichthys leucotaenia]
MSVTNCPLTEDHFLCSICLSVFTNPVATPCGHNFCQTCITEHWDINHPYRCPMCSEIFCSRPELRVNTLISQMADQFRQKPDTRKSSISTRSENIPCDICPGPKSKALQSCLVCLASYCETHLEPHMTVTGLKGHHLIDPVENLEGRLCKVHNKPLELFCRTDQVCVCILCMVLNHKPHDVVPVKDEYEAKKAELGETEADIQAMIQKRQLKIEEIRQSMELSNKAADREKAEGVQAFTALRETVERGLVEFLETIAEKHRQTESQAEAFIRDLEQEISALMRRSSELEQILMSEDHLHLLQSFFSLKTAPFTKDGIEVTICPASYEGTAMRALAELENKLRNEIKTLLEVELKRVQQYAVDVTLDPDTANPFLILSNDGKQVFCGDVSRNIPDNPRRFSYYASVLGKQSFTSGRFYYEVQVKGKTKWDLGIAQDSIERKEKVTLKPENGYWALSLRNENDYKALSDPRIDLTQTSKLEKVGVFVDYEKGLVSFYDVDTATLMYSFTGCSFTQKIYPFFSPCNNGGGTNSAPLIICPLKVKFDLMLLYSRRRKNT